MRKFIFIFFCMKVLFNVCRFSGISPLFFLCAPESCLACLCVDMSGKLLWGDGYRLNHKFRHIETFVVIFIEMRVALRENEGFVGTSILIEICDVEMGVSAIIPAASEEHPSSVARPGVITLHIVAINLVDIAQLHGLQVDEI